MPLVKEESMISRWKRQVFLHSSDMKMCKNGCGSKMLKWVRKIEDVLFLMLEVLCYKLTLDSHDNFE